MFIITGVGFSQESSDVLEHGYLEIKTNIILDSFYIIIDNDYNIYQKVEEGDIITLPVGPHKITAISQYNPDSEFNVDIKEDETINKLVYFSNSDKNSTPFIGSSYPWIENQINLILYTDDDSEIIIDSESVGFGFVQLDLPDGLHKLETKNPLAGNTKEELKVTSKRLIILEMFNKPLKTKSQYLSFFPGASQLYKGEKWKGILLLGSTVACLAYAAKSHIDYIDYNLRYNNSKMAYDSAEDPDQAFFQGKSARELYDKTEKAANIRDICLYCGAGILIYNLVDALWNDPDGGYREPKKIDILKDLNLSVNKHSVDIKYSINF